MRVSRLAQEVFSPNVSFLLWEFGVWPQLGNGYAENSILKHHRFHRHTPLLSSLLVSRTSHTLLLQLLRLISSNFRFISTFDIGYGFRRRDILQ
ncbi:hypothetical protein QVD17_20785 [Tagetes erecta]|uniref:Uncharacterized protein n=1 Tax=Tagetes erecta TaxID=13708 RepID=A0AAD8NXJ5_TARER|nr:hypothetical protein QVD17_20785 [Tagetes erecta]